MSFKTMLRRFKHRWKYGPRAKYLKELPAGVRRMTDEEADCLTQARSTLPVLSEMFSFTLGPNPLEERLGARFYAHLLKERNRFVAKHCRDFSCGVGFHFNRNGESNLVEPYDLERKLSDHLVKFLKRHGATA